MTDETVRGTARRHDGSLTTQDEVINSETNILNLERVMLGKRQSDRRDSTWYGEEARWKFDNAGRSYKFKRKYFEK